MEKFSKIIAPVIMATMVLAGCAEAATASDNSKVESAVSGELTGIAAEGVQIVLSDERITVDGEAISEKETDAVHADTDIIYYEEGKGELYGEGDKDDEHSKEEADAHTVVHITQPGQYVLSGCLSKGQIAVDLGEDAEDDPNAVVTLVLNNIDITCDVAPAVIFYNVYEPCEANEETATKDVDTSNAGANVILGDGSINNVYGSYVARIYKPDSVVLNEDGTEVVDEKKLHKYDAAFYSKMSMNIDGDTGILNIFADNEGLDSELHLTLNGGIINIESGNDGINTNEDYVSVTTINGGILNILVNGATGEGDGIDSNGWLVINGGTVNTQACAFSGDAGIDSDMGIHINGGNVFSTGNMLDRISESGQTFVVFNLVAHLEGTYYLKDVNGTIIAESKPVNDFTYLIISNENLVAGDYTLWCDNVQLQGASTGNMGGMMQGGQRPEMPDGFNPENMTPPANFNPENMLPMEKSDGERPIDFNPEIMKPKFEKNEDGTITLEDGTVMNPSEFGNRNMGRGQAGRGEGDLSKQAIELSDVFTIVDGENYFMSVTVKSVE